MKIDIKNIIDNEQLYNEGHRIFYIKKGYLEFLETFLNYKTTKTTGRFKINSFSLKKIGILHSIVTLKVNKGIKNVRCDVRLTNLQYIKFIFQQEWKWLKNSENIRWLITTLLSIILLLITIL